MTKKVPIKLDISPRLIKTYFDIGPITADELLALRKKILKAQDVESLSYALGYEKREKKQRKSSTRKTKQS
ncbi:MAG: hypothetical protein QY314_01920 [Candidatus Dojkabacteria bacterium]|nr:MAG: hypothetical protein QY314_01920 [Candidatus Dojkabacteria bacterium]